MSNEQEFSRLLEEIARKWIRCMPEGAWKEATLFWASTDGVVYPWATAVDHKGNPHRIALSDDVFRSLFALRLAMADPRKGAWISLWASLTPHGVLDARYNWDDRFYWGQHEGAPWAPPPEEASAVPGEGAFLAELERFPREEQSLPEWYPRSHEPVTTREDPAPTLTAVLPEALRPLSTAWGWSGVIDDLEEALRQELSSADAEAVAALGGAHGARAQEERRLALLDSAAGAAQQTILRGSASVAVRLWREGAALIGSGDPGDLSRYETATPAAELREEPGMLFVLRDIERAVHWVAEATVRSRFR